MHRRTTCSRKRIPLLVVLGAVLAAGAACKKNVHTERDEAYPASKPVYHFLTHGIMGDIFWCTVCKGWNDACERYGIDGRFVAVRMEDNVAEMLGNLETVVAQGSDGIACVISDYKMLEAPLRRALADGVPVVAVNTRDFRPEGQRIPYLRYVGEGSFEVGKANARAALEKFRALAGRPPKHAIYMVHAVGVQCLEERGEGMRSVFEAVGTKFTKVACKFNPTTTQEAIRAFLANHPDVETIHSGCSLVAHWAMEILKQMGRLGNVNEPFVAGNIYVAGIDLDEMLLRDIQRGDVMLSIDQQPYLQGYYAALLLYMYNRYHLLPANDILTGPYVVDQSNCAERLEQFKRISPH